ncbi:glycosyltransferase family 2 protein [Streptacidiphilus sp. PB12-B1b]|nr:glycosyltransferase family 2 protein [Streptacidiphilus sp. PB12-B1b]
MRLDPDQAPVDVVELELGDGARAPELRRVGESGAVPPGPVLALARVHGRPVGLVQAVVGAGEDPAPVLAEAARRELGPAVRRATAALARAGADAGAAGPDPAPGYAPLITVVIATRERPELLARCLASVRALRYPRIEVVVVDNDPVTDATGTLIRDTCADLVRYVREPVRGLAAAHNRGLAEARGEIVAFTDDDVVLDPDWLRAIAAGFADADGAAADPRVGCVTGLILPARLRTRTQVMLEAHGGFTKGFEQRRWRLDQPPADEPLFPFTAGRFGSGANMAFRAEALRRLGGFDPATGTGTPAKGGDDLLAFFRAVVNGHHLVYQPEAVVWHHHRERPEDLDNQAFGYGAGLGAYLTAAVAREPRMLPALLRRLPGGIRYALRDTGARPDPADPSGDGGEARHAHAWPARLSRLQRRGLLYGPVGYLRSRRLVHGTPPPWEARQHGH